jgi:hypothetical protein
MPDIETSEFKNRFTSLILQAQGFPKKTQDRHILFLSAALSLDASRTYSESKLNDALRQWTDRFGDAVALDHVTLRRFLVDEGYLTRDSAGQAYEVTHAEWPYTYDPAITTLDLDALVEEERLARERKKQEYLRKAKG